MVIFTSKMVIFHFATSNYWRTSAQITRRAPLGIQHTWPAEAGSVGSKVQTSGKAMVPLGKNDPCSWWAFCIYVYIYI